MDKFKTIAVGGLGLTLDDFRWFFGRLTAPNEGIYPAFNNLLRGFGDNFIVQGVVASGTTPNVAITEGWVILDGEFIKVAAQTGIDTTTDNKFVKVTTFDSRGNKTFLNGSINDTYESNRAVVQGTTGNLDFDGDTFFDLKNQADTLPNVGVVVLKKKRIEIGVWNMDSTTTVNITHGLSDITKIRSIEVVIFDNTETTVAFLGNKLVNVSSPAIDGGIDFVSTSAVSLKRTNGGTFDSTFFNSGINRGL